MFGPGARSVLLGTLALLLAVPIALLINLLNEQYGSNPYISTTLIWACFGLVLIAAPGTYLLARRRLSDAATVSHIALAAVAVLLVGVYFYWVGLHVVFPADLFIWAETEFVSDILKFRSGYPIYTDQANNESFIYPPGTQLFTYAISWLLGNSSSLAMYRLVQVCFTILAAVVAFFSCRTLLKLACPEISERTLTLWGLLWLPVLLLIAVNPITNPYVNFLHNDGLALLITSIAYYSLLKYATTRNRWFLVSLALIPAVGFFVKQNLLIWAPLFWLFLAFFDYPRRWYSLAVFTVAAAAGAALVFLASYLLWGDNYLYWVFVVPAHVKVSLIRSFQHVLDVWPYFLIGLVGGLALLRGNRFPLLFGLWLTWLLLILIQAYTSGNAFMVHHMGPGSLIAGIWFMAALTRVWTLDIPRLVPVANLQKWLGYALVVASVVLLFSGLGFVRIPVPPVTDDYYRYVSEIQKSFEGEQAERILLDAGTWIYFDQGVLMKDRVTTIVDRQNGETGDFTGIIDRLRQKTYSKVLVRRLHAPDFWYDQYKYPEPTGIRTALMENYHEVGTIAEVEGEKRYLFSEISILEPNSDRAVAPKSQ